MDRANALRKLQGLRRVAAEGSGATPAERATARRLAARLSSDYKIQDAKPMSRPARPSAVEFGFRFSVSGDGGTHFSSTSGIWTFYDLCP